NPTVAPLAHTGEAHLRITARAATEAGLDELMLPVEREIRARVGEFLYGVDDETLESATVHALARHGLTLGAAESCTGGMLGSRITNVAGSSAVFRGGIVSYHNDAKERLLHVPAEV